MLLSLKTLTAKKRFYMYVKTTSQFQMKFIIEDYLQMYNTLQIFTNTFTFNTNKFTSIKIIKTHIGRH